MNRPHAQFNLHHRHKKDPQWAKSFVHKREDGGLLADFNKTVRDSSFAASLDSDFTFKCLLVILMHEQIVVMACFYFSWWKVTRNRGPKKFSLCLNSKSMREKREGEKGQNTVVRKD